MVTLSDSLFYISLSYLFGGLICSSLSLEKRPDWLVSRQALLWATAAAGVLAFFPLLKTILSFSKTMDGWQSFKEVIFSLPSGQAWLLTLAIAALLFALIFFNKIDKDPLLSKIGILLCIVLLGAYVRGHQSASLFPFLGFTINFLQLLAVSVWGGCLLIAAWGTKHTRNWLSFLNWYTLLSMISIVILLITVFLTMVVDLSPIKHLSVSGAFDHFINGLVVNYGQALLIKLILVVPLVLLVLLDVFFIRTRPKKLETSVPVKWRRLESLILLTIYVMTAYTGQAHPPKDLSQLLHFYGASPLFALIYGKPITQAFTVHLHFGMISFVLGCFSLLILLLISFGFFRRLSSFLIGGLIVCYLASTYLAIILAVQ